MPQVVGAPLLAGLERGELRLEPAQGQALLTLPLRSLLQAALQLEELHLVLLGHHRDHLLQIPELILCMDAGAVCEAKTLWVLRARDLLTLASAGAAPCCDALLRERELVDTELGLV